VPSYFADDNKMDDAKNEGDNNNNNNDDDDDGDADKRDNDDDDDDECAVVTKDGDGDCGDEQREAVRETEAGRRLRGQVAYRRARLADDGRETLEKHFVGASEWLHSLLQAQRFIFNTLF